MVGFISPIVTYGHICQYKYISREDYVLVSDSATTFPWLRRMFVSQIQPNGVFFLRRRIQPLQQSGHLYDVFFYHPRLSFGNKRIKSPTEVICMMCSFITYWVGLQKTELEVQVIQDVETIKTVALFFHRILRSRCKTRGRWFFLLVKFGHMNDLEAQMQGEIEVVGSFW